MVARVSVSFCCDVTVFVELLLLGLDVVHTVFLPVTEVLVITTFGAPVGLVTVGCG